MTVNVAKSAWLAGYFTAAIVAVNYAFNFVFGNTIQSLFAVTTYPSQLPNPVQPFSGSLGEKLVGYLGNYIPFDLPAILLLFVSAFLLIMAAKWLVDAVNLPLLKGKVGRIFSVIAWGTVVGYLVMVGFVLPSMNVFLGVVIYTLAASYVAALLGDWTGKDLA